MLTCLRVRSFAIIDELEVELGSGLNIVTGETGAGKSILVDALSLVLGGRASPEVVRTGERQAEVEALFHIEDDARAGERLRAEGIEPEGELIIRRVIKSGGGGRAYLNGRMMTISQLASTAAGLADISSQHEHHTLIEPAGHLALLDAFAKLEGERTEMAAAYDALAEATLALDSLGKRLEDRAEREDLLRFQIREIEEIELAPDEEEGLKIEREKLRHAEKLAKAAGGAEQVLYAQDDALSEVLARVGQELEEAARFDPELGEIAAQVDNARAQLEEVARELGRYAREVQVDPERLAVVEDRLDRIHRLKRKYGGDLEAVLAHRDRARAELDELEQHEERQAELESVRDRALERARKIARALREKRQRAATALGEQVSAELSSLGMGDAQVVVEVAPIDGSRRELEVDGARLSPSGIDRAEFLIAPNPGEAAKPLRKIASGGELSRSRSSSADHAPLDERRDADPRSCSWHLRGWQT